MKLLEIVVKKGILPTLTSIERNHAIDEIMDALVEAGAVKTELREEFVKSIIKREKRGSTGFGHGVAVPHVKKLLVRQGATYSDIRADKQ